MRVRRAPDHREPVAVRDCRVKAWNHSSGGALSFELLAGEIVDGERDGTSPEATICASSCGLCAPTGRSSPPARETA